ncbi:MAG: hypothetical protein Q4C68_08490 [Moraxella sp.]|nr:hypothetical protein [Moraxella sp.]
MNRLAQIRTLPCVHCQAPPPSQACHANWGQFGKGMGIKADDAYTIPLCHTCHRDFDAYQGRTREQARDWFVGKWVLVNEILNQKLGENGVDF